MNNNSIGQLNYRKERLELDSYFTPPYATELLLSKEEFKGSILEPACGHGHISKVFEEKGYKIVSSDLREDSYGTNNMDFMECLMKPDNVVTNPPYSHAEKFVHKALSITNNKVAMLFRLSFLESARRHSIFTETPIARVWVLCKRLPHWDGQMFKGSATFAHCWVVWDKAYSGEPKIGWLI